jgi:glycosyltransferase involved in cell wall biosynthesis
MLKAEGTSNKMRVLIFSAYYEPEIAASLYLSTNLYEDMAGYGWEVDLFVPMPTRGVDNETRKLYMKRKLEIKCGGKLRLHRFSMMREGENPFFRAIRYLILNLAFIWKGLKTSTDIIFVQSTPPTQGAMGAILKKFKRVPMVYGLQDIFPDSLVNIGLTKKGSILYKIGRIVENFTYKNADKIIVISEDFKKNLIDKGVPEEKIEIVYNWVEADGVVPINKENNVLYSRYNLDTSVFYVVYAGNLGYAQNIGVILEAAKLLQEHKDIKFLVFGSGAQEEEYKQTARDYALNNVQFFPMQPYKEVSHVYSLGDVSIVSCKSGFGGSAMPSKTWNIMSAGTAVIANFDEGTDMQEIIEKNNVGLFTKAGDTDGLKEAVLKFYEDKEVRKKMGYNGRQFVLNNLTRNIGTKKYVNVIKSAKGVKDNV